MAGAPGAALRRYGGTPETAPWNDGFVDAPLGVDPREILGVPAGASPDEVTAAFRRLAKRWHPDRAPDPVAADQMALINAAYTALRAPGGGTTADAPPVDGHDDPEAVEGRLRPSEALAPAVRRALGVELRAALVPGETVGLVVPTATWASPQTVLAVTDRRLLWLHDDAPVHRVRELRLVDLVAIHVRPPRPWRRRAQVVCEDRRGRRRSFGEIAPATAAAIVRRVGEGRQTTDRRSGV